MHAPPHVDPVGAAAAAGGASVLPSPPSASSMAPSAVPSSLAGSSLASAAAGEAPGEYSSSAAGVQRIRQRPTTYKHTLQRSTRETKETKG